MAQGVSSLFIFHANLPSSLTLLCHHMSQCASCVRFQSLCFTTSKILNLPTNPPLFCWLWTGIGCLVCSEDLNPLSIMQTTFTTCNLTYKRVWTSSCLR